MKTVVVLAPLLLILATPGCSWFKHIWPAASPEHTTAPSTAVPATTPAPAPVAATPAPPDKPKKTAKATPPKLIITPDMSLAAKVISVNTVGRFVILSFPAEKMPRLQQTLFIYRAGLKVAEVKVTGPQQDNNTVADLVSGEAMVGDTVRSD